jgi:dolichol-phosphate mannosyltransferase
MVNSQSEPNSPGKDADTLTVVMPAYNEEENIELAVQEVKVEVLDKVPGSSLIVVNDGSKDRTGEILAGLAAREPRLTVIETANGGHGPSLIKGLNKAQSEYVFLVDSDMQIPLSCFPSLWSAAANADAVFGMRENRQDPKLRLVLSALVSGIVGAIFGVNLKDTNVPCKIFKRKIWTELFARLNDHSLLIPSIMIAIYTKRHNYKVVDMPVPHRARTKGEGSLNLGKLWQVCQQSLGQLMQHKKNIL